MYAIRYMLLILMFSILTTQYATATTDKITQQRSKIAALERQVADGEKEIANLRKSRAANEQKAQTLARQVEARNRLLAEQRKEESVLRDELSAAESTLGDLKLHVAEEQMKYGEMVREAYRSYSNQNMLTYLFSAKDFQDIARKVANMRAVAELRELRIARIDSLSHEVLVQQDILEARKVSHEKSIRDLTLQKSRLQRDINSARANVSAMSSKERKALQQKQLQERQLDVAVKELQKLIKGNTEGASFSSKTSNLNLPVVGGRVKQYRGNMAEILGAKGADIISIYDGKVVDVRSNRITGKYDIFIAHGEYITSYAGLYAASVVKDQSVKKGQVIGEIGEAVDIISMNSEYKMVFGIYPPNVNERVSAASCFKK